MDTGTDNLAALSTLDENSLLDNIRKRFHKDIIYTYIGDILVAVNPYKRILIFGDDYENKYCDVKIRSQLPPHLFAISDTSYQNMRRTGCNQCCVVSGESGAGKTETTKLMVQHVVHLCKQREARLHERVIQVNPLLEAFGNAQTVMNNNSSRFGKYIELVFSHHGQILGAHISEYLLEKSRVVSQGAGERNFHIFYYMFAGLHPEQLRNNLLDRPEQHRILRPVDKSPIYHNEGEFRFHQEMWSHLREIMDCVGFLAEEVNTILALLAAILHITDITFDNDYDTDGVYIVHEEMLEMAAELLAVTPEEMAAALISNVTLLRGERIVSLKNIDQANDGRDALAKSLYGRLFGWIVRQINFMLQPDLRYQQPGPTIGILDIAGFENFQNNSFEQLCINAANEQLQYYFNQHIFQWEMDEYKREGVKGKDIKFVDNRPLIDMMIETPMGMFSLIDEESRFPQATDQTLVDKLAKNLQKKSHFSRPKGQNLNFIINHYAGSVTYSSGNFLEKNRDTLSANLLECMKNSESQIVVDLFTAAISDTGALQLNPNAPKRSRKSVLLCKPKDLSHTKTRSLSKRAGKKLKEKSQPMQGHPIYENTVQRSMGANFKSGLTDLMTKLLDAEPQFVRCIKPNQEKSSGLFQDKLVLQQLKYTGVMETVRIRRLGYSTRIPHHVFFERFRILHFPLTKQIEPTPSNCGKILKKCGLKDWEMGKTKVFLKYWHAEQLNLLMDKIGWRIVDCQRFIRGFLVRRKMSAMIQLSRQDQAAVRGFCIYLTKASEDIYGMLSRQDEHDVTKWQERQKQKKTNARNHFHQAIHERLRSPSPASRTGSRARSPSPASSTTSNARFMPTPIILGNPVYGNPNPILRDPNRTDTRPFRRQSSREEPSKEFEYPTLSSNLRSPVHKKGFDYNEQSHYARPLQLIGNQTSKDFFDSILDETMAKLGQLDSSVWGKMYYMEKANILAKVYLKDPQVIIDNSPQEYDGKVIGLGAFDNPYRDVTTEKIRKQIAKGVKIFKDDMGNIYATKLTKCDIIVKGYKEPQEHSLSSEVLENLGRLSNKDMKVFDINEFKSHIALEFRKSSLDDKRLQRLGMVSMAFSRNVFNDMDTPCWVCIINFQAIRTLGQDSMFREVHNIARLNLSDAEEVQLQRNWAQLSPNGGGGDTYGGNYGNTGQQRLSRADYAASNGTIQPNGRDRRSDSPGYAGSIIPEESGYSSYSGSQGSIPSTYPGLERDRPPSGSSSTGSSLAGRRDWARLRAQKQNNKNEVLY